MLLFLGISSVEQTKYVIPISRNNVHDEIARISPIHGPPTFQTDRLDTSFKSYHSMDTGFNIASPLCTNFSKLYQLSGVSKKKWRFVTFSWLFTYKFTMGTLPQMKQRHLSIVNHSKLYLYTIFFIAKI